MKTGDRIGSYALARALGRGEAGATWTATRVSQGDEGVLKILDMGEAKGWSGPDLFGHEVEALKTLSHPGIPRFIESFEDDSGGDSRLVLAMELAPGEDLDAAVAKGRRFTEAEISSVLAGLADILAYLGALRPPVVHRDVNPRNVLLSTEGRVSLVDFSGAQEALKRAANPGATMIGTAGYIPLEQVSGRASPRSDLYGAAATALFLLTRRNPSELAMKALKPDLDSLPSLGRPLASVLDSWLEPDEALRRIGPSEAARILRGQAEPPSRPIRKVASVAEGEGDIIRLDDERPIVSLPSDSKIAIVEGPGRLEIAIPPSGLGSPAAIGIGGFSLFWLAFVAFWTFMSIVMGAPIFFTLFSLPFWAVGIAMGRATFLSIFGRSELVLDALSGIAFRERIIGRGRVRTWPITDLGSCSVEAAAFQTKGDSQKELVIEAGAKKLRIGRSLSEREICAMADKIEAWRESSIRR
jgi:eukaryotic-like serine/threonine-protein kinase